MYAHFDICTFHAVCFIISKLSILVDTFITFRYNDKKRSEFWDKFLENMWLVYENIE